MGVQPLLWSWPALPVVLQSTLGRILALVRELKDRKIATNEGREYSGGRMIDVVGQSRNGKKRTSKKSSCKISRWERLINIRLAEDSTATVP